MDYYEEDEEAPEAPTSLTSLLSDNDNTPKKGGKEKDGSLSRKEDEEEDEEEDEKEEEDDVIEQPAVESEADKKQRLQPNQSLIVTCRRRPAPVCLLLASGVNTWKRRIAEGALASRTRTIIRKHFDKLVNVQSSSTIHVKAGHQFDELLFCQT